GAHLHRLLGQSQETAVGEAVDTLILTHRAGQVTSVRRLHGNGRTLELKLAWPPVELFGQTACVLTLHDVSEREGFKRELERYQAQLESLVEERTAALSTAMREAEAANHAKGVFLSSMSHELRTPLNAILGFSRLLERDPAMSAGHRQKLSAIHDAGERLLNLINEILETSRNDSTTDLGKTLDPDMAAPPQRTVVGLDGEGPSPRLLIVDDQADNRWLITHLLESAGFRVDTAENGKEAIDAFIVSRPDLIFMDMRMPVMDGGEATRRIRALPGGADARIVGMTASTLADDQAGALAAGCDCIVAKPLAESEVFAAIAQLLDIRYRYAEPDLPPATAVSPGNPPPLAPTYRTQLGKAAEQLDLEECMRIAQEMAAENAMAAAYLLDLLDQYRFDTVLAWCQQASASNHR
ncbi:MAG TPA: response regulator, partial [Rhodocyclaceae bacterium]|nr:response regulator [Rhodocyclaceae bacterium]